MLHQLMETHPENNVVQKIFTLMGVYSANLCVASLTTSDVECCISRVYVVLVPTSTTSTTSTVLTLTLLYLPHEWQ